MMGLNSIFALSMYALMIAIPAVILYFVIKFAIKNAIKELKNEGIFK